MATAKALGTAPSQLQDFTTHAYLPSPAIAPNESMSGMLINNESDTIGGLKIIYEPYAPVWSAQTVSRVTIIVVVMILTIIGNTSLIAIIVCHPKLRRKRVNIFLVNLAIGDLMVCFVTMTTEILFVAFGEWVLGAASCKLIVYGQIVTLASATFLLTGMSIDRYQVIVKPLQSLRGQPKIWVKVIVAWGLALICATPQLFIFVQTDEGIHPDGKIKHRCRSTGYTAAWQRKLYITFLTTYILVIPTIIMSYCYMNIIKVVWMRNVDKPDSARKKPPLKIRFGLKKPSQEPSQPEQRPNTGNRISVPKKLVSASKRNVIIMTLTVIIGFVMCWTPYFVVSLIRIYSDYTIEIPMALSTAEIFALVHSALNPILYGIFSTKAARRLCSKVCKCCSSGSLHSPPDTVVSEDDTCITGFSPRDHHHISPKIILAHKASKPNTHHCLWLSRISVRLRGLFRRRSKQRHQRPLQATESNIPLLIYGRILNGNTSTVAQRDVLVKASIPSVRPQDSKTSDCTAQEVPMGSLEMNPTSSGSPDNLSVGSALQERELDGQSDMVEYLSTL